MPRQGKYSTSIGDLKLEQAKDALIAYLIWMRQHYMWKVLIWQLLESLMSGKILNFQKPSAGGKKSAGACWGNKNIRAKRSGVKWDHPENGRCKKHQFTVFRCRMRSRFSQTGSRGGHAFEVKGDRGFGTEKGRVASIGSTGFFERSDSIYKASHLPGIIVSYSHKWKNLAMPHRAGRIIMAFGSLCISDGMPWGRCTIFFRLEVKSAEPKTEFVKKLGASLEKKSDWKLANSTTDYEIEIRLIEAKDGSFVPFFEIIFHEDEAVCLPEECDCNVHPSGNGGDAHVSGKTISERKCTDFRSVSAVLEQCWSSAIS